jgi:hypothetical protein
MFQITSHTPSEVLSPDVNNLIFGIVPSTGGLANLHPSPGQIFCLWQTFLDKVNPLTRIIHVPITQQRFLAAMSNPENISKPTEALIFAVYFLSIISLSSTECKDLLRESKTTLLTKYQNSTQRALLLADFINSSDLDVLRAYVLFLVRNTPLVS